MALKDSLKSIFLFNTPKEENEFILSGNDKNILYDVRQDIPKKEKQVSLSYEENLKYVKNTLKIPENNDVVLREFKILDDKRAFLFFYDGMTDSRTIDEAIIEPLLQIPQLNEDKNVKDVAEKLIAHAQLKKTGNFDEIIDDVNFGSCGLIVEDSLDGFSLDVRSWEHRSVQKPETEQSLYGPQEAFSEMLRTNSALIRKILKTEKLICMGITVGKVSKTRGVLMYLSDVCNEELIKEVKKRVDGVCVDYIFSIEELSMLLEDHTFMITNQILSTERPDRAARALAEGRVCLIMNGNPRALIFPTNVYELMHAASDAYMRYPYANMTRILRLIAMGITLLLPAAYLAITLFHHEMIPTFLAYAISSSRESVPFPSIIELLIMDLSFELIREAGIRMPSTIGSTLGIVGGLILGQAAVSAKIVSPLLIIVIAITGIGSFATPNYSLGWSYRILRLIFIVLGTVLGFYGIAVGIFIYACVLGAQESFGVPFLSPLTGKNASDSGHSLFVKPIWKDEERPDFLKPKRKKQEPKISRKWKIGKRE